MCFRACAPNTPPLVLAPTYMYMKIFSHTESSAADFSISSVSPQTVEHILVFVLDDGTAGVVTVFIVSTFPV